MSDRLADPNERQRRRMVWPTLTFVLLRQRRTRLTAVPVSPGPARS
jgi:hypothetical protein